ncbi:MAG: M23 family metallopeptidase [bacterium]|nr:M23 family metallopeptidase [bacterium]
MIKKSIFYVLLGWISICVVGIWLIGGKAAIYLWNASIFLVAPAAILALVVQLALLIKALYQKRKIRWNVLILGLTVILALPIVALIGISPITYPAKENSKESLSVLLPVKNAVLFGGKDYKTHAMWPSECYAYDILCEPYEVGSSRLSDYGSFGADVMAPVSGTVIGMENGEPDIIPNSDKFTSSLGNYVYIKIDHSDSYMILAHLKKDSIVVKVNMHIEEGQIIGKIGNSGTTSEPHLHLQRQKDNPLELQIPICAEGLPITFHEESKGDN